ncbi:MAG: carboxypeptidase-like regulatory domain-containing protein, partial [Candidatus Marinimicrobia bacterium]|nr:carboxypeptidase-like regulatory domain-containing protein [Candidatus Neomarinimicrobiota bacterium]
MRISKYSCSIICLITFTILIGNTGFTQTYGTGTIEGFISDLKTGEPLIGVNIVVLGTYLGTSSDFNGYYKIRNVNPSEYTLELSYIGYKIIQKTGVKISTGDKVTINFEMEQTALALGQEIIVIGEKPLIEMGETSTIRSVSKEDIYNKPLDNVQDIISEQVGVT